MPVALTIAAGKGRGRKFRFEAESVTIGRAASNDLVLNDAGVSRTHARIERQGAAWVLLDRASANGVELNGAVVGRRARLREGDRIGVGPVTFEFRIPAERRSSARRSCVDVSMPARAGLIALAVLAGGITIQCSLQSSARPGGGGQGALRPPPVPREGGRATEGMPSGDLAAARAAYERGRRKLEERRIAPRNLYDAWKAFTEARGHLEGASDPGPLGGELARLIEECERDLHRECSRLRFSAARFGRYGDAQRAEQTWREVLRHFPGEDPGGCREEAEENLVSEPPREGSE